jgi:hypothetical protein
VALRYADGYERIARTVGHRLGRDQRRAGSGIISIGMQAIEPQLADARANVTRLVQAFLRLNREMEIAEKSIQASQLTL